MNENPLKFSEKDIAYYSDESAKSWAEQVRKGLDIYREYFNNLLSLNSLAT
jgi:hypothetical protein